MIYLLDKKHVIFVRIKQKKLKVTRDFGKVDSTELKLQW